MTAPARSARSKPVTDRLDVAEALCAERGKRLTPIRRKVLELLLKHDRSLKAYELLEEMRAVHPGAAPPTVYRALDFLEKQGFAHRIESLNSYVACRKEADGHAAAFLICDCCGATREIEPKASAEIIAAGASAGYALTAVTIEAHGLCADCRG